MKAYFYSYAHQNEFSEQQMEQWDLIPGNATYVVPELELFTQRPDKIKGVTSVFIEPTKASQAAGKKILEGNQ